MVFLEGQTAETIAQNFPALNLEQVYGAIAFYLAHRAAIDKYLEEGRIEFEKLREEARQADPMFYQKLADAKRAMPAPRSCSKVAQAFLPAQ